MKPRVPQIHELLFALALGAIGGALCGAIILTIYSLIGPVMATGHVRHWDPSILPLAALAAYHGGIIGIIIAPIGYLLFLRRIGLKKAIFPASIGTVVGGVIGAFSGLGMALLAGVLGFFLTLCGLWLSSFLKKGEV
jgi:hypothetical protein